MSRLSEPLSENKTENKPAKKQTKRIVFIQVTGIEFLDKKIVDHFHIIFVDQFSELSVISLLFKLSVHYIDIHTKDYFKLGFWKNACI